MTAEGSMIIIVVVIIIITMTIIKHNVIAMVPSLTHKSTSTRVWIVDLG